MVTGDRMDGGGGRIRTFEGISRQIYSLLPLAARAPLQRILLKPFAVLPGSRCRPGCAGPCAVSSFSPSSRGGVQSPAFREHGPIAQPGDRCFTSTLLCPSSCCRACKLPPRSDQRQAAARQLATLLAHSSETRQSGLVRSSVITTRTRIGTFRSRRESHLL